MPDLVQVSNFHLIRPLWLLMLIPVVLVFVMLLHQQGTTKRWQKIIAPHLLKHLIVGKEQRARIQPVHLFFTVCAIAIVALAGPAWEKEASPFTEDEASLLVALDLSISMNAIDVRPTRLLRAQQKVRDLLAMRIGARTGLIAYTGSAHMVLPLTDDPGILETYLTCLSSDLMPVEGKDPSKALALARDMLDKERAPGTILFITDGISREHLPTFVEHSQRSTYEIIVLGVGTRKGGPVLLKKDLFLKDSSGKRVFSRLDREGLDKLSSEAGAYITTVSVDDSDVRWINSRIESHLTQMQSEDESRRWKDSGYLFVFPVAALALFWFRRGWSIVWAVLLFLGVGVLDPSVAVAGDFDFVSLWLTPDQQGRYHFEKGDYEAAAERFENPLWKGISYYLSENFEAAVVEFARVDTPSGYFNIGNAYAHSKNYEQAVESYDLALKLEPDYLEAHENRELVLSLIPVEEKEEEAPPGEPSLGADEIQFDEKGEKGKEGEVDLQQITDEQIAEMWMRQIQTTPADFLRLKFLYQSEESE